MMNKNSVKKLGQTVKQAIQEYSTVKWSFLQNRTPEEVVRNGKKCVRNISPAFVPTVANLDKTFFAFVCACSQVSCAESKKKN